MSEELNGLWGPGANRPVRAAGGGGMRAVPRGQVRRTRPAKSSGGFKTSQTWSPSTVTATSGRQRIGPIRETHECH